MSMLVFWVVTSHGLAGTVVGANLCVPCPLEVKCTVIGGVGGVAGKKAHTIISQWQCFVATVESR
jgi:hypothetical protein